MPPDACGCGTQETHDNTMAYEPRIMTRRAKTGGGRQIPHEFVRIDAPFVRFRTLDAASVLSDQGRWGAPLWRGRPPS
jgi:hypothetical protein